jgi:hypothetical protein
VKRFRTIEEIEKKLNTKNTVLEAQPPNLLFCNTRIRYDADTTTSRMPILF